jgi:hypothetical protein
MLGLALVLCGCARQSYVVPTIARPACIDFDLQLDGKVNAIQSADQDLFTIVGKLQHPTQEIPTLDRATMTVCYKGKQ